MATLREKYQSLIDGHKAEIVKLEAELAAGGTWLEQEWDKVEEWFAAKIAQLKGHPTPPTPPAA